MSPQWATSLALRAPLKNESRPAYACVNGLISGITSPLAHRSVGTPPS